MSQELLILSRADVLATLSLRDCIEAVERAFLLHAEGHTLAPGVLGRASHRRWFPHQGGRVMDTRLGLVRAKAGLRKLG